MKELEVCKRKILQYGYANMHASVHRMADAMVEAIEILESQMHNHDDVVTCDKDECPCSDCLDAADDEALAEETRAAGIPDLDEDEALAEATRDAGLPDLEVEDDDEGKPVTSDEDKSDEKQDRAKDKKTSKGSKKTDRKK
jgi:hypothetical protein